jgi:subtilisin family serine protease
MSRNLSPVRVVLRAAILPVVVSAFTACKDDSTGPVRPDPAAAQSEARVAPELSRASKTGKTIPGKYIVVLKSDAVNTSGLTAQGLTVDALAANLVGAHGGTVSFSFAPPRNLAAAALSQGGTGAKPPVGFVAANLSEQAAAALARDPNVSYVEPDQIGSIAAVQSLANGEPWGLDRIDQFLGLSRTYAYGYTGAGVNAYIIDTGLDVRHADFGGRARVAYDVMGGGIGSDCIGHGTHVAGTVGGATYGVAKSVRLHAVKVFQGCANTYTSDDLIRGLWYVYYYRINPAVANLSLQGGFSQAINDWVTALTNSGVFVAVAAGNSNVNACTVSPGSTPAAFTTAASGSQFNVDDKWPSSNWGSCVDAYAPGFSILSAKVGGGSVYMSGTSMASPHVAGVAALLKQAYGNQSSAWITSTIKAWARPNQISGNVTGTPNLLLYKGAF